MGYRETRYECPVCDYVDGLSLCPICFGDGTVSSHVYDDLALPLEAKRKEFEDKQVFLLALKDKPSPAGVKNFKEIAVRTSCITRSTNPDRIDRVLVNPAEDEPFPWDWIPLKLLEEKMLPVKVNTVLFAYVVGLSTAEDSSIEPDINEEWEEHDLKLKGIKASRKDMKIAYIGRHKCDDFENDDRVVHTEVILSGGVVNGHKAIVKGGPYDAQMTAPFSWLDSRVLKRLGHDPVGSFHLYLFKIGKEAEGSYDLFGADYFGMANPLCDAAMLQSEHIFELPTEPKIKVEKTMPGKLPDYSEGHHPAHTGYNSNDHYYKNQHSNYNPNLGDYYNAWGGYDVDNDGDYDYMAKVATNMGNGKAHLFTSFETWELEGEPTQHEPLFDWEV